MVSERRRISVVVLVWLLLLLLLLLVLMWVVHALGCAERHDDVLEEPWL